MSFTANEQDDFFEQCYGCNIHDWVEQVENSMTILSFDKSKILMSLLSDVQEEIAHSEFTPSYREEARQSINRIKYIIVRWYSEECKMKAIVNIQNNNGS